MRTRTLGLVAAAVAVVLSARPVAALDAPHDQTFSTGQCDNCHTWYTPTASGAKDFSSSCVRCHNNLTNVTAELKFPWAPRVVTSVSTTPGDEAVPGESGNQHSWSGYAASKGHGAVPPAGGIGTKLIDGKLQCATCHDIHNSSAAYAPNSRLTSIPLNTAIPGGTGTLKLTSVGTTSKAWRVKVQTAASGSGTFVISHDFGLIPPSFFNWVGGVWVAGTEGGAGKPYTDGVDVLLDDTVTKVQIAGAAVGDYWDFYVSYPALRASNVKDAFCYGCHQERVMDHVRASGADPSFLPNGKRVFSHPVSVAMDANHQGYDRTGAILDANGASQTLGGDGRSSNDLQLDGDQVRCTTCHAVHNATSNSLVQ